MSLEPLYRNIFDLKSALLIFAIMRRRYTDPVDGVVRRRLLHVVIGPLAVQTCGELPTTPLRPAALSHDKDIRHMWPATIKLRLVSFLLVYTQCTIEGND